MKFTLIFLCVILSLMLFSCNYAKIVDIVHYDTSALPKSTMFSDPALTPYRIEGIVFAPRMIHLDHKTSRLDLIVYSAHIGEDILVESAELCGLNGQVLGEMASRKNIRLSADLGNPGMFVGGIALINTINNTVLLSSPNNSKINLHLVVRVGDSKKQLSFELEPKNRTYIIQR